MQVYRFRENQSGNLPTVVTIGNFDGMHLGHQALTESVVQEAKRRKLCSALVTFNPHPQEILHPRQPLQRICTPQLQKQLFAKSGIDEVHVIPFTPELAKLDAEKFASRYLIERFNLEKLIIGYDFRFGKNRTGDFILLERFGKENAFSMEEIAPIRINGQIVSSTLIRQLIRNQRFSEVEQYLGRPYSLLGTVQKGEQRGRVLGFPTANLIPKIHLPLPSGVYVTKVKWNDEFHYGITNIGTRPTFGELEFRAETWIFDFKGNLYGEMLEIWPLKSLRPEKKFSGIEELKKQIQEDVNEAQQYLQETSSSNKDGH
jgi:riboflavin kinase / FMN adenylyltransferase